MEILAHETWFTDERPGYDLGFLFEPLTLAYIAAAVIVAALWRWASRRVPRPEIPPLEPVGGLAPWVPRLLGIHAGVSLIAQAYAGTYLAPGLELPSGVGGDLLAIAEGVLGVWLVSGFRIRPAAWALVAAGPIGLPFYGVIPIVERVDLLGIALFLALVPPGADRHGAVRARPGDIAGPLAGLRLLTGGSLVVLALTEKLARPELALAIIDEYPFLNVLDGLGLGVGDVEFVRVAGGVELFFGLLIMSGAMPQLAMLLTGIPFNVTLFFFGASELIGHLPFYGVMLALVVYGSSPRFAPVVSWLPGRRVPVTVGAAPP